MQKTAIFCFFILFVLFLGVSKSLAVEVTVFGPFKFTSNSEGNYICGVPGKARVIIHNGNKDGEHRVKNASVFINDEHINDIINQDVYDLEKEISLSTKLTFRININGGPDTYLTLTIVQDLTKPEDLGRILSFAVGKSDIEEVRFLVKHGADVNYADSLGYTPLMASCNPDITKFLLEMGADVNTQQHLGFSALYNASMKDCTQVAKLLLENGADVNSFDQYGITPLIVAAKRGHVEVLELLLNNGADVNASSEYRSALIEAGSAGGLEAIKLLLNHGAEHVNENETPFARN